MQAINQNISFESAEAHKMRYIGKTMMNGRWRNVFIHGGLTYLACYDLMQYYCIDDAKGFTIYPPA
jgi:hypothetical protein